MNDLDEQIRAALKAEDAETLSKFESDESLPSMMIDLYQGRRRWINASATLVTFVIFGVHDLVWVQILRSRDNARADSVGRPDS